MLIDIKGGGGSKRRRLRVSARLGWDLWKMGGLNRIQGLGGLLYPIFFANSDWVFALDEPRTPEASQHCQLLNLFFFWRYPGRSY